MSSSRRMEQVFYQAHIKASNYILRHTSHRTRSIIEHLALGLAVCSFCVVIITHRTFIHREDNIVNTKAILLLSSSSSCDATATNYNSCDDYYANSSLIEEGRNVSIYSILMQLLLRVTAWSSQWLHLSTKPTTTTTTLHTTSSSSSMWSKKIPISCLRSIPGFRDDANVNHILLHLNLVTNNDNATTAPGISSRSSSSRAFTIHRGRDNEQIVSGMGVEAEAHELYIPQGYLILTSQEYRTQIKWLRRLLPNEEMARERVSALLVVVVVLLTMIKHSTVQATFAAKAKQSHWAAMFSTCSYVGGRKKRIFFSSFIYSRGFWRLSLRVREGSQCWH
jgi:hypothetical protein